MTPSLSVCLCLSLASDSSETVNAKIIKIGMVTASDMKMHHVSNVLTSILIQGQTS